MEEYNNTNEILRKEKENKELILDLKMLVAKNKNDTHILLNKIEKIEENIVDIKNYIKWKKIWTVIYWIIVIGSFFGIWLMVKDSLGSTISSIKEAIPDDFSIKNFLNDVKNINK